MTRPRTTEIVVPNGVADDILAVVVSLASQRMLGTAYGEVFHIYGLASEEVHGRGRYGKKAQQNTHAQVNDEAQSVLEAAPPAERVRREGYHSGQAAPDPNKGGRAGPLRLATTNGHG